MTNNQLTEIPVTDGEIQCVLDAFDYRTGIESHEEYIVRCALAELQERRKADSEPVAYMLDCVGGTDYSNHPERGGVPLYRHAQQPVVPEEMTPQQASRSYGGEARGYRDGWNACRAATLQAGNSPAIPGAEQRIADAVELLKQAAPAMLADNHGPDGPLVGRMKSPAIPEWIPVSERMPDKNQDVLISVNFDSDLVEPLICSARYTGSTFRRGDATVKPGSGVEQATHWMPLPAAPQEVK